MKKNLKDLTMDEHIQSYWGMDDANEMECEKTLITEKDYCETFNFNWQNGISEEENYIIEETKNQCLADTNKII